MSARERLRKSREQLAWCVDLMLSADDHRATEIHRRSAADYAVICLALKDVVLAERDA